MRMPKPRKGIVLLKVILAKTFYSELLYTAVSERHSKLYLLKGRLLERDRRLFQRAENLPKNKNHLYT
jgi:hypothetical protein